MDYKIYDVVKLAVQCTGALSYGESIDPELSKDAIQILNSLIAEWSLGSKCFKIYDETFDIPENRQYITLGSSPTISGDILLRPSDIDQVSFYLSTDPNSISIKLPVKSYSEYRSRSVQNIYALPTECYINSDYPLQYIYFFPGITAGHTVRVMGKAYLQTISSVSDYLILPPEYFQALYLGLALRLSDIVGMDPNAKLGLVQSLGAVLKPIKDNNFKKKITTASNDFTGQSINNQFNFFGGM